MADKETIEVYNNQVDDYIDAVPDVSGDATLVRFLELLAPESHVLDLGCGPGMFAAFMKKQGHEVDATDASFGMVETAQKKYGLAARLATFDDLNEVEIYDGVWANFSLLHASPDDLPNHLLAIRKSLKPDGLFHMAVKTGSGVQRDTLGRNYSYYSPEDLQSHLVEAGFSPFETATGEGKGLAGDVSKWVAILSRA